MELLKQIRETIKRYNLLKFGDRIVLGISGGPDSLALLYMLNELRNEFKLYLHIAHLDHMMRKESIGDRLFVENIAKKLNIPVTTEKIDISRIIKKGSLEEEARKIRLNFLFKVAKKYKCNKIALGHNKDDQAETVFMRILRGTGLYGLQAILPLRKIGNYTIIRPLIETERKYIEGFLRARKISPRIDKTNKSVKFFRNRIRHKLMPLLEKEYNPNIKQVLSDMASNISLDYNYLRALGEKALTHCCAKSKSNNKKIVINLDKFKKLNLAIQKLALRIAISKIKGNMRRLTYKHIQEIESLLTNRPINSIVDLPQSISIKKKKLNLVIYKNER